MSKDLEKEYKALISEDAPDLWDRIEAGLEPKQPAAKKISFIRRYRAWGMAASAVLCLAVMVPFLFGDRSAESGAIFAAPPRTESQSPGLSAGTEGQTAPESSDMFAGGTAAMNDASDYYEPDQFSDGAAMDPEYAQSPGESVQASEQAPGTWTVRATVTLVRETEDGVEYVVKVEEDSEEFFEDAILYLYDQGLLEEVLAEGGTYLFDISIIDLEEAAFLIENVQLDEI